MSKRAAAWMVIAYFALFFGAVFLRVDYYPFTWVPMYGERETTAELNVKIGGLDKRGKGFRATLADGRVVYINRKDLNMPAANFRRLYNERMFGEGPPQHRRERRALNTFNNWWYETLVGPWSIQEAMYPRQVLDSVNRTLGRGPSDPDRVVKIQAEIGQISLTREHRSSGDLGALSQVDLVSTVTPEGHEISVMAPPALKQE
jgi:hypothetical protein